MNDSSQELMTKSGKCRIILNADEIKIDISDEKRNDLKKKSKLAQEITQSIFPIILRVRKITNIKIKGNTVIMMQKTTIA
jgi:hypothetical protein